MGEAAVLSAGKVDGGAKKPCGTAIKASGQCADVRTVRCGCVRTPRLGRVTQRTASVSVGFGVPHFGSATTIVPETDVLLGAGRIVLLLGPSGSGKSGLMQEIGRRFAGACMVGDMRSPRDAAVIDAVAPYSDFDEAVAVLTRCGLGEARLWLRRFDELSDGERFRARLACAIGRFARRKGVVPILCDEFCSGLHRRVAKAISYNLRKLADEYRLCVVLACSHDDIVKDLQPDTIVRLPITPQPSSFPKGSTRGHAKNVRSGERPDDPAQRSGAVKAKESKRSRRVISIRRNLQIQPGCKADYDAFAAMHYRATDELGFVDKVFVLRDRSDSSLAGIVVYAHGPLELSLRNQATGGRFVRQPGKLNREMRILRRLVMHPDLRGCGLGHYLVRKTLPMLGKPYVECLASMGAYNPVFERAGMKRIGQYEISPTCRTALAELAAMDIDPGAREFLLRVCRSRRVRSIVSHVVREWYAATTAGGESRVSRQSSEFLVQAFRGLIGSRPVYFLWRRS